MKKINIVLAIFLFSIATISNVFGQEKEYEKLHLLYVDGNYDKLYDQAIKLTEKESTRKEPLPYLYTSMALFYISENPERDMEEFKNAFKNSVKYAAKFRKIDTDNDYINFEPEYFVKLKKVLNAETKNYFSNLNDVSMMKKGSSYIKNYYKMDKYNPGQLYLLSIIQEASNSRSSLLKTTEDIKEIESNFSINSLTKEDIDILIFSIITYAKYKKNNGSSLEGKKALDFYLPYLKDNETINNYYKTY